jgi:PAS domain S-box-containing protein
MTQTSDILIADLSNHSDELHLILNKENEILFSNQAFEKRIRKSIVGGDLFKCLGLGGSMDAIRELYKTNHTIEHYTELNEGTEHLSIKWKIVANQDTLVFIGTDLGDKLKSEEEKFAQALHDIKINRTDESYTGRLTEIQRVLSIEVDKFKLISENVSDIVCLHEPKEAHYVYVSPSCQEVTGYLPSEMEGRSPYDFFHPDMIAALQEDHRKREAGEIPANVPSGPSPKMIYLFKTKAHGFRWMESHSRPIFDKLGNVILILSTSRDVHEREEAEKEKERYFNYYRTLGNNIPNGAVFMIDRNYNYIIAEGEEFEKLGRTSAFYVGKNAKDVYSPEKYKRLSYYFEKMFSGESVSFEWEFNGRDYIFLGKPCIEKDGSIPVALLLTQNITDSKAQATKLSRTLSELEAKNFELDSFVYRTSHDLRSPLASILGLTEIMLRGNDLQNMTDCTLRIRESVNRLDKTIRSILEYSQNDKLTIQRKEIQLQQVWNDSLASLKDIPEAKGIIFSAEGDTELVMKLDEFRMTIILNNLLSNAIKYSDSRKQERFVKLIAKRSVNGLQLVITDNGIGIHKDQLDLVFNMFHRASDVSKGSGLGLYIVRQAVEKLGGVIILDSTENIGSSFTITIPN